MTDRLDNTLAASATAEPGVRRWDWPAGLLLTAALLQLLLYFGAVARDRVLWRDEAHALALATAPFREFLGYFAYVEHQTSYLVVLRMWSACAGTSELAAAALSLACALGAVALMGRIGGTLLKDARAGVACAVLLAASPLLLRHNASAVRPYAFALFADLLVVAAVLGLWRGFTARRVAGTAFCLLLAMNAQPVNIAFGGALGAVWAGAMWGRTRGRPLVGRAVRSVVLAVLTLLAALPMLVQSLRFARVMQGVEPHQSAGALSVKAAFKFVFGSLDAVFPLFGSLFGFVLGDDPGGSVRQVLSSWPAILAMVLCLAALGVLVRRSAGAWRPAAPLLGTCLLFSALCTGLLLFASLFHSRTIEPFRSFSATAPAFVLLVGMLLAPAPRLRTAILGLLLVRNVMLWPAFADSHPGVRSDARAAAEFIRQREAPSDVIVLANAQLSPAFSYYYRGTLRQVHHPYEEAIRFWDMVGLGRRATSPASLENTLRVLDEAARDGRRVWFLTSGSPAPEPTRYWYCPDALPILETALSNRWAATAAQPGRSRWEPFFTTLYESRRRGAD